MRLGLLFGLAVAASAFSTTHADDVIKFHQPEAVSCANNAALLYMDTFSGQIPEGSSIESVIEACEARAKSDATEPSRMSVIISTFTNPSTYNPLNYTGLDEDLAAVGSGEMDVKEGERRRWMEIYGAEGLSLIGIEKYRCGAVDVDGQERPDVLRGSSLNINGDGGWGGLCQARFTFN